MNDRIPYTFKRHWRIFRRRAANVREDFWRDLTNLIAPFLWQSPQWRQYYYDYREACWRNAQTAVSFPVYVYWRLRGRDL